MSILDPVRTFHLQRDTDLSGISGTGVVAHGVEWPDGAITLWWPKPGDHVDQPKALGAVTWHPDIQRVEEVHGHGGKTRIVWTDTP